MPAKTLKPHTGAVIGKPRPGDTASMVGFIKPVVQKNATDTVPSATIRPIKEPVVSKPVSTQPGKPPVKMPVNKPAVTDTVAIKPDTKTTIAESAPVTVVKSIIAEPTKPVITETSAQPVVKHENNTKQRYIHVDGQPPVKVCEPIARMGEAYAKHVHEKTFKVGDFVGIRENGIILDSGEISMVCVDMYFVETKKIAPRFWFGNHLEKVGR
ncbi:MAG: hypothetical protein IJ273_03385 [Alphaproteobacteria bacterium]|nr:hypothetical protein [Alphaproteobacteria bacterium]